LAAGKEILELWGRTHQKRENSWPPRPVGRRNTIMQSAGGRRRTPPTLKSSKRLLQKGEGDLPNLKRRGLTKRGDSGPLGPQQIKILLTRVRKKSIVKKSKFK